MADGFRNGVCLKAGGYKNGLLMWGRRWSKDGLAGGRLAYKSSGAGTGRGVEHSWPSPGHVGVAKATSTRLPAKAAMQHPGGRQHLIAANWDGRGNYQQPHTPGPATAWTRSGVALLLSGHGERNPYCAVTSMAREDGRSSMYRAGGQTVGK
jgi:hypothetical protein